jgi:hypothetical protein
MIDETEIITKKVEPVAVQPESGPAKSSVVTVTTGTDESKIGKVSVRAWLAITLVLTFCVLSLLEMKINESFFSVVTMCVGFYFGQRKS